MFCLTGCLGLITQDEDCCFSTLGVEVATYMDSFGVSVIWDVDGEGEGHWRRPSYSCPGFFGLRGLVGAWRWEFVAVSLMRVEGKGFQYGLRALAGRQGGVVGGVEWWEGGI